jgi:CBS domain containing-hemolysin-like protein
MGAGAIARQTEACMDELWLVALKLLAIVGLIAANGFFVAAEFSLVSIRPTRIDQLAEEGSRIAKIIQKAKRDPTRFLIAAQIGITLASLALGWVAEPTLATLLLQLMHAANVALSEIAVHAIATVITFAVITYLHIVLGENIPKAFALQRTEPTVFLTALPMEWLAVLFTPFIGFLNRTGQWMLNMVGVKGDPGHHLVYTEDEIKRLLAASHEEGILEAEEKAMLEKVFDFSDKDARDVMVPRPDIKMVPVDATWDQLMALVEAHGFTRYPVYEGDADHVLGFLHLKDLFAYMASACQPDAYSLRVMLREVLFVPETKSIMDLLTEFKRGRYRMAIVMDEYGGTSGLVTPQDLVEEIVGRVDDEFSAPRPEVEKVGPGRFRILGRLRIEDFNERFGTQLPSDEYDTIAGWVFGTLGREAHVDDEIASDEFCFTVEQLQGHRITSILFQHWQPGPEGAPPPSEKNRPL